jgi:hypothetical protein
MVLNYSNNRAKRKHVVLIHLKQMVPGLMASARCLYLLSYQILKYYI